MFNFISNRTLAVIKREFKAQVFTKTFIFSTIFVPIIMFGLMAFVTYMMKYEDKKDIHLSLYTPDTELVRLITEEYEKYDGVNHQRFTLSVDKATREEFQAKLELAKKKILEGELNGVFFLPRESSYDKRLEYYSNNPKNQSITRKIRTIVNRALIANHFASKQVSKEDLEFARKQVALTNFKVTEGENVEKDSYGAYIVAFVMAFLLYMSLLMIGMQILKAVVEEKENRVVEVLLSSLRADELMTGKIIATTSAGLLQIFIWMLPFILSSLTTLFVLPEKFQFSISLLQIGYFVINYGIGLVTFLGLYAAIGAVFDNMTEAQQGATPIMFLILVPFYICFSLINDPTNSIAEISSILPFASIIVMPVRMAIIDVPIWQIGIATLVNLVTLLFIFSLSGKIYRIGILKTGKRPNWKEIYQWAKQ
jgi:ABC-2 type transport system permease protein